MAWLNRFNTQFLVQTNDYDRAMKICTLLKEHGILFTYKRRIISKYTDYNIDTIWYPNAMNNTWKHVEEIFTIRVSRNQYDSAIALIT